MWSRGDVAYVTLPDGTVCEGVISCISDAHLPQDRVTR